MIDIHAHILPGMDDGSQSLDESLEMAEIALESGVHTIAATPHSNQVGRFENYDCPELQKQFERLISILKEEHLPLRLVPGMEIFSSDDVPLLIQRGKLFGLNHSRYFLVEFPFDEMSEIIRDQLIHILQSGVIPVIAHPERYYCVQDDPSLVYEWLRLGCYAQVNRGSLLGRFGRRVERASTILLENGLITCVASDAHSPYQRTTYMKDIQQYLEDRIGENGARQLLFSHPSMILSNQSIPPHGQMPRRRRSIFF